MCAFLPDGALITMFQPLTPLPVEGHGKECFIMKRQILVVESDRAICQSIQNRMQDEGIEVFYVSSVAEALKSMLKQEYCLVIISLQHTEVRDMEPLRMIRNTKRMPIIALTNRLPTNEKVALFQAGANALAEKAA